MNRRNFILGLGTAATLSGAASVTGANLQDAVNPEADFRVIAAEELNVLRNDDLDQSLSGNANYTDVGPGSFDHNDTSATEGTNLTVNGQTDGDLSLALATGNDPNQPENNFTAGEPSYINTSTVGTTNPTRVNSTNTTSPGETVSADSSAEAPLQIENNTAASQDVAVQYQGNGAALGDDVTGGPVDQKEVETLFQFFVSDGTDLQQISPDGTGSDEPYSYVSIGAGETKVVSLGINLTESISNSIQEAAEATGSGGFASGAEDDVDLLDTVAFGVDTV